MAPILFCSSLFCHCQNAKPGFPTRHPTPTALFLTLEGRKSLFLPQDRPLPCRRGPFHHTQGYQPAPPAPCRPAGPAATHRPGQQHRPRLSHRRRPAGGSGPPRGAPSARGSPELRARRRPSRATPSPPGSPPRGARRG